MSKQVFTGFNQNGTINVPYYRGMGLMEQTFTSGTTNIEFYEIRFTTTPGGTHFVSIKVNGHLSNAIINGGSITLKSTTLGESDPNHSATMTFSSSTLFDVGVGSDGYREYSYFPSSLADINSFVRTHFPLSGVPFIFILDNNSTTNEQIFVDSLTLSTPSNFGTLTNAMTGMPTWTRPVVDNDSDYTINLTVTVRGTGNNAIDGSSLTITDSITARVTNSG